MNDELVIGIIKTDWGGLCQLKTFDGTFDITDDVIDASWKLIAAELGETASSVRDAQLAGSLARGRVVDGHLSDISYLIRGREWPTREPQ